MSVHFRNVCVIAFVLNIRKIIQLSKTIVYERLELFSHQYNIHYTVIKKIERKKRPICRFVGTMIFKKIQNERMFFFEIFITLQNYLLYNQL